MIVQAIRSGIFYLLFLGQTVILAIAACPPTTIARMTVWPRNSR